MKQDNPDRMHSRESDKAGIMSDTGEIPGGCIILQATRKLGTGATLLTIF